MPSAAGMAWVHSARPTAPIQDGFTVTSKSGAVFEDVDLSEKEWMDYDEKLGESIGIYDLEWKLAAVKL